jgi:ADP-heptose:LPS heptosyltransferase
MRTVGHGQGGCGVSVAARRERTALVLFPGALGDFICFVPTLHALRLRHRAERLRVIAPAAALPLATRPGLGDEGLSMESAAVARLFIDDANLDALCGFRRVYDVYSWFASGVPAVRRNLERIALGQVRCLPFAPPVDEAGHVARHYLATAGCAGAAEAMRAPFPLTVEERATATDFWHQHELTEVPVLAVHRGAGNRSKRWAAEGFQAVVRWWNARGGRVLEVMGPADDPEPLAGVQATARDRPIGEVAALLARADLILGVDTGISHLAGAVGSRGVVLFGPTAPRRWRPVGGRLVCLKGRGPVVAGEPIPLSAIAIDRVTRALGNVARASLP